MSCMDRAKTRLILRRPFYGSLLLEMPIYDDPGLKVLAMCNGLRMLANPVRVAGLADEHQQALCCHEILHVVLRHVYPSRRRGRNIELWNIACDLAVNAILKNDGFSLWPGAIYDQQFDDMTAEAIYDILSQKENDEQPQMPEQSKDLDESMDDGISGESQDKSNGDDSDEQDGDQDGKGEQDGEETEDDGSESSDESESAGKSGNKSGREGSDDEEADGGQDTSEGDQEVDDDSTTKSSSDKAEQGDGSDAERDGDRDGDSSSDSGGEEGDKSDGVGDSGEEDGEGKQKGDGGEEDGQESDGGQEEADEFEHELDEKASKEADVQREWTKRLVRAVQLTVAQGKCPGAMKTLVDDMLNPVIPWQQLLDSFISEVCRDDYGGWDRRYITRDTYIDDLVNEGRTIVVAIDTSGSIDDAKLNEFVAEVRALLKTKGTVSIRLIACDADIQYDAYISPNDEVPVEWPGRGGTDFRPVFDLISQDTDQTKRPAAILYFTDLVGTYPDEPPASLPTLWVVKKTDRSIAERLCGQSYIPKFGTLVSFDNEKMEIGATS